MIGPDRRPSRNRPAQALGSRDAPLLPFSAVLVRRAAEGKRSVRVLLCVCGPNSSSGGALPPPQSLRHPGEQARRACLGHQEEEEEKEDTDFFFISSFDSLRPPYFCI